MLIAWRRDVDSWRAEGPEREEHQRAARHDDGEVDGRGPRRCPPWPSGRRPLRAPRSRRRARPRRRPVPRAPGAPRRDGSGPASNGSQRPASSSPRVIRVLVRTPRPRVDRQDGEALPGGEARHGVDPDCGTDEGADPGVAPELLDEDPTGGLGLVGRRVGERLGRRVDAEDHAPSETRSALTFVR